MNQPGHDLAFCLEHDKNPIMGVPRDSYYSHPLQYWLDAFPAEQIHVVQYENLVAVGERQAAELRRIRSGRYKPPCRYYPCPIQVSPKTPLVGRTLFGPWIGYRVPRPKWFAPLRRSHWRDFCWQMSVGTHRARPSFM